MEDQIKNMCLGKNILAKGETVFRYCYKTSSITITMFRQFLNHGCNRLG
jgi:hypothetical protein